MMKLKVNEVWVIFLLLKEHPVLIIIIILVLTAVLLFLDVLIKSSKKKEPSLDKFLSAIFKNSELPVIVIDNKQKVSFINEKTALLFSLADNTKKIPDELLFVEDFLVSQESNSQKEIMINNNNYLAKVSKFSYDTFSGALLILVKQTSDLQNIIHELKTPIAAIQAVCELLLEEKVQDQIQKNKFICLINDESKRLDELLTRQKSKTEIVPVYQKFKVAELFQNLELLFINYQKKNKEIVFLTDNKIFVEIKQDEKIIKQILINLIANAFKYTKVGTIKISAYQKDGYICFSIKDTGIGIAQSELDKIFEKDYRNKSIRSDEIPGQGLGLAIVSELVNLLAGKIEVKSEIAQGSEFIVCFNEVK